MMAAMTAAVAKSASVPVQMSGFTAARQHRHSAQRTRRYTGPEQPAADVATVPTAAGAADAAAAAMGAAGGLLLALAQASADAGL